VGRQQRNAAALQAGAVVTGPDRSTGSIDAEAGSVPPETYTSDYFLTECEGYQAYSKSRGAELPKRLSVALDLARIDSAHSVLDLGCGRGEVVRQCALTCARTCGVDYSRDALELARAAVAELPADRSATVVLARADAKRLPFAEHSFDRVLMLDIVEHLYPWELNLAFREARRVLKPGGFLLVHTMPNLWYYSYGYPVYRLVSRLARRNLPRDPRQRWRYVQHVHVNEQDVIRLRRALCDAGFQARVWLQHIDSLNPGESRLLGVARRILGGLFPLSLVFCNDIFAEATPAEGEVRGPSAPMSSDSRALESLA
jgi:ubiquinone/menaquinone biosynthesis C-methylase UbiE